MVIYDYLKKNKIPFKANDNISEHLNKESIEQIKVNIKSAVDDLLKALLIDVENDHNTKDTAQRITKMYIEEIFKGRYY